MIEIKIKNQTNGRCYTKVWYDVASEVTLDEKDIAKLVKSGDIMFGQRSGEIVDRWYDEANKKYCYTLISELDSGD